MKSLSHPGGNLTGFSTISEALIGKRMELFKEMVPQLRRVLILSDPEDPVAKRFLAEARTAATTLKLHLLERQVTDQADIERVFRSVKRGAVDGVFTLSPNLDVKFSSLLIRLAAEKRLPLPSHRKEWVEQGALFSYSSDLRSIGREAARYADKILKGTPPPDLPVEQPMRFELVINLKTAKALWLTIPQSVLFRADRVIQ